MTREEWMAWQKKVIREEMAKESEEEVKREKPDR